MNWAPLTLVNSIWRMKKVLDRRWVLSILLWDKHCFVMRLIYLLVFVIMAVSLCSLPRPNHMHHPKYVLPLFSSYVNILIVFFSIYWVINLWCSHYLSLSSRWIWPCIALVDPEFCFCISFFQNCSSSWFHLYIFLVCSPGRCVERVSWQCSRPITGSVLKYHSWWHTQNPILDQQHTKQQPTCYFYLPEYGQNSFCVYTGFLLKNIRSLFILDGICYVSDLKLSPANVRDGFMRNAW